MALKGNPLGLRFKLSLSAGGGGVVLGHDVQCGSLGFWGFRALGLNSGLHV